MREQVPTSLTTIDAIMNTREFALGVTDGRAGRGYRSAYATWPLTCREGRTIVPPDPGAGNLPTTVRPPRPCDRREIARAERAQVVGATQIQSVKVDACLSAIDRGARAAHTLPRS